MLKKKEKKQRQQNTNVLTCCRNFEDLYVSFINNWPVMYSITVAKSSIILINYNSQTFLKKCCISNNKLKCHRQWISPTEWVQLWYFCGILNTTPLFCFAEVVLLLSGFVSASTLSSFFPGETQRVFSHVWSHASMPTLVFFCLFYPPMVWPLCALSSQHPVRPAAISPKLPHTHTHILVYPSLTVLSNVLSAYTNKLWEKQVSYHWDK